MSVEGDLRAGWVQAEPSLLLSTGAVRASSVFPILSVTLLFFGGLCVAASEFHRSRHNVILSAGIFFVSAGEHLGFCPESITDTKPEPGPEGQSHAIQGSLQGRSKKMFDLCVKNENQRL